MHGEEIGFLYERLLIPDTNKTSFVIESESKFVTLEEERSSKLLEIIEGE